MRFASKTFRRRRGNGHHRRRNSTRRLRIRFPNVQDRAHRITRKERLRIFQAALRRKQRGGQLIPDTTVITPEDAVVTDPLKVTGLKSMEPAE